jgi:hypothetical protein
MPLVVGSGARTAGDPSQITPCKVVGKRIILAVAAAQAQIQKDTTSDGDASCKVPALFT